MKLLPKGTNYQQNSPLHLSYLHFTPFLPHILYPSYQFFKQFPELTKLKWSYLCLLVFPHHQKTWNSLATTDFVKKSRNLREILDTPSTKAMFFTKQGSGDQLLHTGCQQEANASAPTYQALAETCCTPSKSK